MESLKNAQIKVLIHQSIRIFLGSFLITLAAIFILWDKVNHKFLLIWASSMLAIIIFRFLYITNIKQKKDFNPEDHSSFFVISGILTGITLGLSVFLLKDFFSEELAFIFIIIIAMMAGAISSVSSYLPSFYAYFFSLYIPVVIKCLILVSHNPGDRNLLTLSFLFITTTPIMISFGRSINKWITQNTLMLHEKDLLADILEKDKEKLRLSHLALNSVNEGIMITNSELEIIYTNLAFTRISGFEFNDVVGQPTDIFEFNENQGSKWALVKKKGIWEGEIWKKRKNGDTYPAYINIIPMSDDDGNVNNYIIHFKDITEKKKEEEMLKYFANYDELTNLPNRKYIYDHLDKIFKSPGNISPGALFFLDLNDFKIVNDSYGHQIGDLLLKEVAARLSKALRPQDFLGRLGGDEFVVVLENTDKVESENLAKMLIDSIRPAFQINGIQCKIGLSIGIAVYPSHGNDRRSIMHYADTAMYEAKLLKGTQPYVIFNSETL